MRLRVFPTVEAPKQAREGVASLASIIDQASLADVKTVIGELVTLSVLHGASRPIEVDLTLDDCRLDGVVSDDGAGVRALVRAKSHTNDPLVLRIVEGLVEDWAVNPLATEVGFRMNVQLIGERG